MKILITGFDPFGSNLINPSIEAVKLLPTKLLNVDIITLEVPTVLNQSIELVQQAIHHHQPDCVLSVGLAQGRQGLTIERVAININDFRIADNQNNQPIDTKVVEDGPDAYLLSVPIKAMMVKCLENNIPASISNTAGTFVCNHLAYGVAHLAKTQYPQMLTGFVHIPSVSESNDQAMSLQEVVRGLTCCLIAIIENQQHDFRISGGKED